MLRAVRAPTPSSERGSAVAEFVMVASLLTVLTLGVMQLALALHVRNTVLDAAAEGARYAFLADSSLAEGTARTRDLIQIAVGPAYAQGITASYGSEGGVPTVQMRVVAPLPLLGLIGINRGLEVEGHAARETAGE